MVNVVCYLHLCGYCHTAARLLPKSDDLFLAVVLFLPSMDPGALELRQTFTTHRGCLPWCRSLSVFPWLRRNFTSSTLFRHSPAASDDFFAARSRVPCASPLSSVALSRGSNGNNFRRRSMREGNFNCKLAIGSENRRSSIFSCLERFLFHHTPSCTVREKSVVRQ